MEIAATTPKVLLVDSENCVLEVLTMVLHRRGAAVTTAFHPCDAVRLVLGGLRPDILVTEFVLPVMHGIALINELRATVPALPAVILTTGAMAFPANFERRKMWILRKPCTPDELWQTVSGAMGARNE